MQAHIASFAILDLETSNLPDQRFNRVGITELSVFAISAEDLQQRYDGITPTKATIPKTPRVLHKLTLMLNPRMRVEQTAEDITGLNNYMLENESEFNDNAAATLVGFIRHLQQPVCLVAHNGNKFDFPIVRAALAKLDKCLPVATLCVDSMLAFWDITTQRLLLNTVAEAENSPTVDIAAAPTDETVARLSADVAELKKTVATLSALMATTSRDALCENALTDWRALNETTPKRSTANANKQPAVRATTTSSGHPNVKRKLLADDEHSNETAARRKLFPTEATTVWKRQVGVRMPRDIYKLGNLYAKTFGETAQAHRAEADVRMLLNLLLHYGTDFRSYAQQHAIPFVEIRQLS